MEPQTDLIIDAIMDDLESRKGCGLSDLDAETLAEIRVEWEKIIDRILINHEWGE